MVERNIRIVKSQEIIYLYCNKRDFYSSIRVCWNNAIIITILQIVIVSSIVSLLARTVIEICQEREREREREIVRDYSYRKSTRVRFFFEQLLNPVTQLISQLLRHCCIIRFKNIYQTTEFRLKRSKPILIFKSLTEIKLLLILISVYN